MIDVDEKEDCMGSPSSSSSSSSGKAPEDVKEREIEKEKKQCTKNENNYITNHMLGQWHKEAYARRQAQAKKDISSMNPTP
jgi:hypothetical protein